MVQSFVIGQMAQSFVIGQMAQSFVIGQMAQSFVIGQMAQSFVIVTALMTAIMQMCYFVTYSRNKIRFEYLTTRLGVYELTI